MGRGFSGVIIPINISSLWDVDFLVLSSINILSLRDMDSLI